MIYGKMVLTHRLCYLLDPEFYFLQSLSSTARGQFNLLTCCAELRPEMSGSQKHIDAMHNYLDMNNRRRPQ